IRSFTRRQQSLHGGSRFEQSKAFRIAISIRFYTFLMDAADSRNPKQNRVAVTRGIVVEVAELCEVMLQLLGGVLGDVNSGLVRRGSIISLCFLLDWKSVECLGNLLDLHGGQH